MPASEERSSAPGAEGAPPCGPRVLLIEDDEGIRTLAQYLIPDVDVAATAAAGLALVADTARKYDVVVLDLGLPDMKGEELVRRVTELRPEAAIVVASGTLGAEVAHCDVRLDKPFDSEGILTAIEQAVVEHRTHREPR